MSDKSNVLKTFNAQFFAFLQDIITIFPENKDISTAKKSFEMVKMANPSLLIKIWFSHIYTVYQSEIDKGNIEFFFEKDYSKDLDKVPNNREVLRIIDTLREPIKAMGPENKEHTSKYLQVLSKLSKMYNQA